MIEIIKNLFYRLRHGMLFEAFQYRLDSIGIIIAPYYWVQEGINDISWAGLQNSFEDYTFDFLGIDEIKTIAASKTWKYSEKELLSWVNKGKKCFAAKYKGEISAFMWIDLDECKWQKLNFRLKDNEAYLFDMFTMKSFRGKGIAPYLRYQSYKILKDKGRDKIYSLSDFFNSPSISFKKKLNAKFLKLCLYIDLFNKLHWNWVIKSYSI